MKASDLTTLQPGLLERVQRRDETAMNVFFEAFFPRVFGYVLTMVRDRTLADDLVQESFIRMHRALDRLDPARDPAPWVFTVAANTVRDHWRSRDHKAGKRSVDFDDLWDEPEPDEGRDPESRALRSADAADVRACLERLSPGDREIILLRDYEQLETNEIAEGLDLKPEAVRQRHSRAVRRLGKLYKDMFGEDGLTP